MQSLLNTYEIDKIVNVHLDSHFENSILQSINKLPEIDRSPSNTTRHMKTPCGVMESLEILGMGTTTGGEQKQYIPGDVELRLSTLHFFLGESTVKQGPLPCGIGGLKIVRLAHSCGNTLQPQPWSKLCGSQYKGPQWLTMSLKQHGKVDANPTQF